MPRAVLVHDAAGYGLRISDVVSHELMADQAGR